MTKSRQELRQLADIILQAEEIKGDADLYREVLPFLSDFDRPRDLDELKDKINRELSDA